MRRIMTLPILAASLALANPVLANDHAEPIDPAATEMIENLNDPDFQDGLATMMSGMMTAMMDLPIGQIAASMDKAIPENMKKDGAISNIDPDATIGDLARRDNPDFDRDIDDKMRKGTAMMGIMASEFDALLPQLMEMGAKMKRRMDDLD